MWSACQYQAEVGGRPRLKLLAHRMHVSFRSASRGSVPNYLLPPCIVYPTRCCLSKSFASRNPTSSYGRVAWGLVPWAPLGHLLNTGGAIPRTPHHSSSSTGGSVILKPLWCENMVCHLCGVSYVLVFELKSFVFLCMAGTHFHLSFSPGPHFHLSPLISMLLAQRFVCSHTCCITSVFTTVLCSDQNYLANRAPKLSHEVVKATVRHMCHLQVSVLL